MAPSGTFSTTTREPSDRVQSPRDLVPRMLELRAQGYAAPAIGRALGIPESTVRNWWQGRTCLECGVFVDRSRARAESRCVPCRMALQVAQKVWTREAVLDAIRRFAAAHGRPPTSTEWLHSDPVNGYPPRTAVYRSRDPRSRSNPFVTWADAIVAAGFARPIVGVSPGQTAWSRDFVSSRLLALAVDGVAPPAAGSLYNAACRFYGSWSAACAANGLRPLRLFLESRASRPEVASPRKGSEA